MPILNTNSVSRSRVRLNKLVTNQPMVQDIFFISDDFVRETVIYQCLLRPLDDLVTNFKEIPS